MKAFIVIACLVAVASAEPPVPSYGAPAHGGYSAPAAGYGAPDAGYGAPGAGIGPGYGAPAYHQPTVFRHVYVHAAPDEPVYSENKVIRVPGGGDKHVNIIFVKAPSSSSQQNTEVILPEQPQQKTVVYVLVKKPEAYSHVNVKGPQPSKPSKPEVFFIRYKGQQDGGYGAPVAGPAYGAPAPVYAPAPVQPEYGAPAPVVHGGYN